MSCRPDSYGGASTIPPVPPSQQKFTQSPKQYSMPPQNGYSSAASGPDNYPSLTRTHRDFRDYSARQSTGPPPGPANVKEGYGYHKYQEEDPIYPR